MVSTVTYRIATVHTRFLRKKFKRMVSTEIILFSFTKRICLMKI